MKSDPVRARLSPAREWRSPAIAAAVLMTVYLASLAPGVTFWDAGEFIAAVHTLGIPHPPGTPLYILLGKTWTLALGFMGSALALNMLSAVCTALSGAITAHLVFRSTNDRWIAVAAAVVAGTMSTAWLNATETEVYAVSLLLSMLMIDAGEQAGSQGSWRWLVLTGYLIALAVPLHLSALIAAPAAIVLASERMSHSVRPPEGTSTQRLTHWLQRNFPDWRWSWAIILTAVVVLSVAMSGMSIIIGVSGLGALAAGLALERHSPGWRASSIIVAIVIAFTVLAFMIVRAAHDPGINQGDPVALSSWMAVVTREQYSAAPMWPRQAPVWMQAANMLQYFDWQLALSLAPSPPLSPGRGLFTIAGLALGILGSAVHRRADPRRWRAVLALLLSGSIGVMVYLNLKAGPSIGWGILPDSAPHEPRERDYFFILAFWAWGIWIAMGVAELRRRTSNFRRWTSHRRRLLERAMVVGVAFVPIALNWQAVERRSEPSASLARRAAQALLASSPERAVLFVAGDNDSYPLWYLQQVERFRPDVSVLTIPILPADWYLAEVQRRHGLRAPAEWRGLSATMSELARDARRQGRPVAAAVSVSPAERAALGELRVLRGWVWVESDSMARPVTLQLRSVDLARSVQASSLSATDQRALMKLAESLPPAVWSRLTSTERYMAGLLACPRFARESATRKASADSLDSTCNFR